MPLAPNREAKGMPVAALVTFVGISEHPTPVARIQFSYVKFPSASFKVGITAVNALNAITNSITPPIIAPNDNPLNFPILSL